VCGTLEGRRFTEPPPVPFERDDPSTTRDRRADNRCSAFPVLGPRRHVDVVRSEATIARRRKEERLAVGRDGAKTVVGGSVHDRPSCLGSDQGSSTLLRTDEYMSIPARPVRLEWKKISSPSAVIDGSESVLQHRRHPRRRVPLVRYFIAFLHGDVEDMKRKAALARERPSSEDMMSHVEALALARSGRLQKAARTSTVAVDIARRSGRRERAALFHAATAVSEAFYGNRAAAREKADEGARPRQGLRRRLCGRVCADPLWRRRPIAGSVRRSREEPSRGHVSAVLVSADASGPVLIDRARSNRRDSRATGRLALRSRARRHRLHRTLRRPLPHLRPRTGVPRSPVNPSKPLASSSGFSLIEASSSSIRWTPWRACNWRERSRSRRHGEGEKRLQ
jgi:hypothetical protein